MKLLRELLCAAATVYAASLGFYRSPRLLWLRNNHQPQRLMRRSGALLDKIQATLNTDPSSG